MKLFLPSDSRAMWVGVTASNVMPTFHWGGLLHRGKTFCGARCLSQQSSLLTCPLISAWQVMTLTLQSCLFLEGTAIREMVKGLECALLGQTHS